MSFALLQIRMLAVLSNQDVRIAFNAKLTYLSAMDLEMMDERALSTIYQGVGYMSMREDKRGRT
jgi:hypothetical protein